MTDGINRHSTRTGLDGRFLTDRLRGAKRYDRIAGYFRSSVLEFAHEAFEEVEKVRIVCNADISDKDLKTARIAEQRLIQRWNEVPQELDALFRPERYRRLHDMLSRGNVEIRVAPSEFCGFVHGKAGVIEAADGTKSGFIGSLNETRHGWGEHYEILWEDRTDEGVAWIQAEFEHLWKFSTRLPEVVVTEIKRFAERREVTAADLPTERVAPASAVESPLYKDGFEIAPWQRGFVEVFFQHLRALGQVRLLLADEVGLGKTLSMGMCALVTALTERRPVLILAPATLVGQWQVEFSDKLGVSVARWSSQKKTWIMPDGDGHIEKDPGAIKRCPTRIGVVSTGLVVHRSEESEHLLAMKFGTVILDEAHKARRSRDARGDERDTNLRRFMLEIAERTRHLIMGTATPVQTDVRELWDAMQILDRGSRGIVLGNEWSHWRYHERSHDVLTGEAGLSDPREAWDYVRNPLPPTELVAKDRNFRQFAEEIRLELGLEATDTVVRHGFTDLPAEARDLLEDALTARNREPLLKRENPFVRHVVLRRRGILEEKELLPKIAVDRHPDGDGEPTAPSAFFDGKAVVTSRSFDDAYAAADDYAAAFAERQAGAGFMKNMLRQRLCSSYEAGIRTAEKLLRGDAERDVDPESEGAEFNPDITDSERRALERMLECMAETREDPKRQVVEHYLADEGKGWLHWYGCICFSQFYDTAEFHARHLAERFPDHAVALYAGAGGSRIYRNGKTVQINRERIKTEVAEGLIRLVVATDAAAEGLNLQALGTLINIDLPWNPSRLEQRIGRIKRFGQRRSRVDMLNLVYRGTVDERVYNALSERMQKRFNIFKNLPDVLDDDWIEDEEKLRENLKDYILNREGVESAFDIRYNDTIRPDGPDWRACEEVISRSDLKEELLKGWFAR